MSFSVSLPIFKSKSSLVIWSGWEGSLRVVEKSQFCYISKGTLWMMNEVHYHFSCFSEAESDNPRSIVEQ